MVSLGQPSLHGRRVLVVEDDYVIASDLACALEDFGAEVVGPSGSVADALALVKAEGPRLDGAVLDINLRDERVYPVADALSACGVPFIFTTGYDAMVVSEAYAGTPRCEKPVDRIQLARMLSRSFSEAWPEAGRGASSPS
jgi:CheY-like chemotaxis protein